MKNKLLITVVFIFLSGAIIAQSVGINNNVPDASAILDVKSTTKGMLVPRTSSTSRLAIINPAKGLLLYDTTTNSFWFYNSSAWLQLTVGSNGWNLTGNTGINPVNQFIGTTDDKPLRFRVNNTWAGEIHPSSTNIFLGIDAGNATTTGQANTAFGEHALLGITGGNFNTAQGYYALSANSSGINNTAQGSYALTNNTMGSFNTAAGRNALFSNTTGAANTAIGEGALLTNNTASGNTANGYHVLYSNTSGTNNTASGNNALYTNTTGNYNTASGYSALYLNATGNENTANGFAALYNNTSGYANVGIGSGVLTNNSTGSYNSATGSFSLAANSTGEKNTASGAKALYNNAAGAYNCAMGFESMINNNNGFYNTAVGVQALSSNTFGYFNTAVGMYALGNNVTGGNNIAIGYNSGTGGANAATLSNTIGIGNTDGFLNGASNQAIIGNTSMVFIGGKVNWGVVSDERIKRNIKEDVKGLDFILRLRPVTYRISNKAINEVTKTKDTINFAGKYDGEKITYTGFLAQEVEKAATASGYDFSGYTKPVNAEQLYTIRYAEFVVPLVKAMQEQQALIQNQQKQIDLLEKRLVALEIKR